MRERNADRHRAATVGFSLDHRKHAKEHRSQRPLDLDLLCRGVELEVLDQLREERLRFDKSRERGGEARRTLVS